MNEKFKDYIKDLPPELQEKAKDIETMDEMTEFLSENDVELPDDALDAVSGGCSAAQEHKKGHIFKGECPDCGGDLIYWDNLYVSGGYGTRATCEKTNVAYVRGGNYAKWTRYTGD